MHIFAPKPRKFEPAKITAYTVIHELKLVDYLSVRAEKL